MDQVGRSFATMPNDRLAAFALTVATVPWLFVAAATPVLGERSAAVGTIVLSLVLGLAVILVVGLVQPARPRPPALIAALMFAGLSAYVAAFSTTYWWMSVEDPERAFTEALDRWDALYLTIATLTTTGYGDIAPLMTGPRLVATSQMLLGALVIAITSARLATSRRRAARLPDDHQ